jgi:hypothetical protein
MMSGRYEEKRNALSSEKNHVSKKEKEKKKKKKKKKDEKEREMMSSRSYRSHRSILLRKKGRVKWP